MNQLPIFLGSGEGLHFPKTMEPAINIIIPHPRKTLRRLIPNGNGEKGNPRTSALS
jgi:hypothetical protein